MDRRLLTLFAATTVVCMLFGVITPFLPLIAESKHLTEWRVGVIFSAHPFAGLIASPFIGTFMYRVGRRNTLCMSF